MEETTEPTGSSERTEPVIPNYPLPDLVISAEARHFLNIAGRWATFLGVLGFIITGLVVIFALVAGTIFSMMGSAYSAAGMPSSMAGIMSAFASFAWIFYIAVAAFYFFFSYYLYNFGAKVKAGTAFNDSLRITQGLGSLKSFFKLWGITVIVIIALYILVLIGVFVFASTMHSALTPH